MAGIVRIEVDDDEAGGAPVKHEVFAVLLRFPHSAEETGSVVPEGLEIG
jgi:hypothetical protein